MKRAGEWAKTHQLTMFIVIVLFVTAVMTATSLWIYRTSGAYRFDLSRPGYEDVRGDVKNDDDDSAPFSTTGLIDDKSVRDFLDRYDKITGRLNKMNDYGQDALTDENLGLSIDEIPDDPDDHADDYAEQML